MSQPGASLRVSMVQSGLHWHDPSANRTQFATLMAPLAGATDLVVLPEMFTTGFTMEASAVAESAAGPTLDWLRQQARAVDAAIAGSLIVESAPGVYRNRMMFVMPDGAAVHYDKRHLFRMGGEDRAFVGGQESTVVSWRGFDIGLQVCYDLRFPVWSRRRDGFDYDLLLYVANWPTARGYAWSQLLRARAIENQSYVVGVNRSGRDGQGVPYPGLSAAIDFMGAPLAELAAAPELITVALGADALQAYRAKFPAYLDADRFQLR